MAELFLFHAACLPPAIQDMTHDWQLAFSRSCECAAVASALFIRFYSFQTVYFNVTHVFESQALQPHSSAACANTFAQRLQRKCHASRGWHTKRLREWAVPHSL